MRLYEYLNEARKAQDETAWKDRNWNELFMKDEFIKWLKRKTTTFFYGQWEIDINDPNHQVYETTDNEGNILILKVEKDKKQHKTKSGTRDPEKTKREMLVRIGVNRGASATLLKKTTVGEDMDKIQKWEKQVQQIKDMLKFTFGIDMWLS